jgi:hypothetical protein
MKFVGRSGYGKKCLEISPSIHASHNILILICHRIGEKAANDLDG